MTGPVPGRAVRRAARPRAAPQPPRPRSRRAAGRGRRRAALPDRLPRHAARAAHPARDPDIRGRAGHADRPEARGVRLRDVRRGRRRPRHGHDLGGDRGPDAPRGGDLEAGWLARPPRSGRSPCRTGCAPPSSSGCSGCCRARASRSRRAVLRTADAQGPRRGRAAAAGRARRRPGHRRDRRGAAGRSHRGRRRDEVRERLLAEGHEVAEFWIVAAGPNSASPHHEPGERVIRAGEPIVLDIGGTVGGYASDITRMVWVTGGDPSLGPTTPIAACTTCSATARRRRPGPSGPASPASGLTPSRAGSSTRPASAPNFLHRTGHGIGLEVHEDPYLVAGNGEPLAPGMAFSVEPGIYLEGRYGARDRGHRGLRGRPAARPERGAARPAGRHGLTRPDVRPSGRGIIRRSVGLFDRAESPR